MQRACQLAKRLETGHSIGLFTQLVLRASMIFSLIRKLLRFTASLCR
jgi:hypothetical protein